MAEKSVTGEQFVQIGVTALRDPTGAFLPSVPLYIKTDSKQIDVKSGLADCEKNLHSDISGIFAGRFARYVRAVRMEKR